MNPIDDELRARFGELRAAQSVGAPSVSAVLNRAPHSSRPIARRTSVLLVFGAAASIGALMFAARQLGVRTPARETLATQWPSPTTSLMPVNPQSVLAPPPLLSSVLDGATSSTLWRKGD